MQPSEFTMPEIRRLDNGWHLTVSGSGDYATPSDIPDKLRRIPAMVPGTVAGALEASGKFDREKPIALSDRDFWYLLDLEGEAPGPVKLCFAGLATIAEVFLNGEKILDSRSQFVTHEVSAELTGNDKLAICFRALNPHLATSGPRQRWKPQMITPPGLRLFRTTLLGHMPGWCPNIDAIGPFRPITIVREQAIEIDDIQIDAGFDPHGNGLLGVSFRFTGRASDLSISCAGETTPVMISSDGRLKASLTIANIRAWWPHTHGNPQLYDVILVIDGVERLLARTGFRVITLDQGIDGKGFSIEINGIPVFCRGAVWTNADIVRMPCSRKDYLPHLTAARDAGMNMIRIGGTMTYESPEFFALCDELGLMVWQDFMFANFDYPASDTEFVALVEKEAVDFLQSCRHSPSLTVLCGGSEIYQQAAMLGLPHKFWTGPLTAEILPTIATALRPDVIYVPNSPFGGAMPFSPDEGVTHYYGVGAYCRPLDDARRANVRFAAECLAFAHIPEQSTLDRHLTAPVVHDPRWKARVPRDRNASWDFEDIRDHYLREIYDFDPSRLRREDPESYLAYSRAVTVEVTEATYAEWRRPGSTCSGALVWTLQDLLPGPGWGIIDSTGLPKPVWHGMRRAFRAVEIILTDEGTNGVYVHVLNETPSTLQLRLDIAALKDGATKVVGGACDIELGPRNFQSFAATDLFGAFFDTAYAFRFGPPAHDVTVARLTDRGSGAEISTAFHFPRGRSLALHAANLKAALEKGGDGAWHLTMATDRLAQSVHLSFEGFSASDNWFHLMPGADKIVRLTPIAPDFAEQKPSGEIRALGGTQTLHL